MINKIEREREFNSGFSEEKSLEVKVEELLDKMDELVDVVNQLLGGSDDKQV